KSTVIYPNRPTIVLSDVYKNIAGTFFVRKPFHIASLTRALNQAAVFVQAKESRPKLVANSQLTSTHTPRPQGAAIHHLSHSNNSPTVPTSADNQDSSGKVLFYKDKTGAASQFVKPVAKESAFESLPSANESGIMYITKADFKFAADDPSALAQIQYRPQELLLGYVQKAYREAIYRRCDVRLEGPWRPITVYFQDNEIGVEKNLRHLYALSLVRLSPEQVKITVLKRHRQGDNSAELRMPMEQFLWKLALRTSLGRVPEGTSLYAPVKLRRWPDLSRNALTPYAYRIAALWTRQSTSILHTADILNIPLRYILVFYSAALAAGLMGKSSPAPQQGFSEQEPVLAAHSHRNIFKLIVNRFRDV
ncbi:MAG: hypothetical protein OEY58_09110, partial [Gammaproteobacteria bacterium]|nr:hypothetical protein [Gammaproteobacteria bacterium]